MSTESGYSYEVVLTFQEAEYYSEWLIFDEGETTKSVEVTVYDSTTSNEAIEVAMAHTVIYVGQGSLEVMEYFLFVNETDRTYIGSKEIAAEGTKETLLFSLPEEATELQITLGLMECCIMSSEEGFVDTMPVLPGGKEVAYSYKVNYYSGTHTFSRNMNYPTTRYDFLFQGESIDVISGQLAAEEPMDIEGTQFNHLSGSDLARGDLLLVKLSGLPETDNQGAIIWAALALVVLVAGSGFAYRLKKRRLQPVNPEGSINQIRQRSLVELAHLDDDFEAGKIPEETYRRLRAEKKAQLVELMKGDTKESGNS
jgi:LPXTG-motif cell wall-anchored protein